MRRGVSTTARVLSVIAVALPISVMNAASVPWANTGYVTVDDKAGEELRAERGQGKDLAQRVADIVASARRADQIAGLAGGAGVEIAAHGHDRKRDGFTVWHDARFTHEQRGKLLSWRASCGLPFAMDRAMRVIE